MGEDLSNSTFDLVSNDLAGAEVAALEDEGGEPGYAGLHEAGEAVALTPLADDDVRRC